MRKQERKRIINYHKRLGLDFEYGETLYTCELYIYDPEMNWSIYLNNLVKSDSCIPYMILYNNKNSREASKCCKISLLESTYMQISVGKKIFWKLKDNEIQWLNSIFKLKPPKYMNSNSVWDAFIVSLSDQSGYDFTDLKYPEYKELDFGRPKLGLKPKEFKGQACWMIDISECTDN